jgi:Domain of unknown function (DUF5134)
MNTPAGFTKERSEGICPQPGGISCGNHIRRINLLPLCAAVTALGRGPEDTDVSGPAWPAAGFAVLMIVIAACRACRPAIARLRGKRTELGADGLHVLMGIAMAGMLQPQLALATGPVWSGVFAAGAAWYGWQATPAARRAGWARRARGTHPGPHAIECAAMVYMLVPVGSWPSGRGAQMPMEGMTSGTAAGNPALTLILALVMLGYALWAADRLTSRPQARAAALAAGSAGTLTAAYHPPALAPRLATCFTIAMATTMGYMLLTML